MLQQDLNGGISYFIKYIILIIRFYENIENEKKNCKREHKK